MLGTVRFLGTVARKKASGGGAATNILDHSTLTTSLESYYTMDEQFGTNLIDMYGTNTATITGATINATGKVATALDFDGTNDYVEKTGFTGAATSSSVQAWVKFDTVSGRQTIFTLNPSTINHRLELNSTVYINYNGASYVNKNTAFTPSTGTWYHFVSVITPTSVKLYVNGVEEYSDTYSSVTPVTGSATMRSGAYPGNISYLNGIIDELAYWSKALTASEVTDLYNSGSGLPFMASTITSHPTLNTSIANYWPLQGDANDDVGTDNLTVNGATASGAGGGFFDQYYDFDGTNDYLQTTAISQTAGNWSASFWFRLDNTYNSRSDYVFATLGANNSNRSNFSLETSANNNNHYIINGTAASDYTFADTNWQSRTGSTDWHHVVTSSSGSATKLYIDGIEVTDVNLDKALNAIVATTGNLTIGAQDNAGFSPSGFMDGKVCHVARWSKELTATEAKALFNGGNGYPYS